MIKAVIFDWDGVLNDSVHAVYNTYLVVLEKLGLLEISFSEFCRLWESDYRRFEEKIGLTGEKREIGHKLLLEFYSELGEEINLFPKARGFLFEARKNYKLGLVTAGTRTRIISELERHGLEAIFYAIVSGNDTKKLKPDPEGLNICADILKVNPKDCVYIGDTSGDVLAAKSAGMIPIAVTWGYNSSSTLKEVEPNYMVENFDELDKLIRRLK